MSVAYYDARGRPLTRRRHRLAVGLLIALMTACVLVGSFAVWLRSQALNTDNATNASAQALANPTVRQAVGTYVVDQLFTSVDLAGELGSVLPSQAADPIAAQLRQTADGLAVSLLATPPVQAAWREASRLAHQQLLTVLDGGNQYVSATRDAVTLNLHPVVTELAVALAKQLGDIVPSELRPLLGDNVDAAARRLVDAVVGADNGQVVILRSSQVSTAQTVASAVRMLAIALPIVALLSLILALLLADGWRLAALRNIGLCLLAVGIALLVARSVLEPRVIDALVSSPSDRPAADVAWTIGTRMLRDIAIWLLAGGAAVGVAALVSGRVHPRADDRLASSLRGR